MNGLVGYSLSYCVRDIIEGRIPLENVHHLKTGTKAETEAQWCHLIASYSQDHWKANVLKAALVVMKLRKENRIYQPRVEGGEAPNPSRNGYWKAKGRVKRGEVRCCSRLNDQTTYETFPGFVLGDWGCCAYKQTCANRTYHKVIHLPSGLSAGSDMSYKTARQCVLELHYRMTHFWYPEYPLSANAQGPQDFCDQALPIVREVKGRAKVN